VHKPVKKFTLKFRKVAAKTENNFRGYLFAAPGRPNGLGLNVLLHARNFQQWRQKECRCQYVLNGWHVWK